MPPTREKNLTAAQQRAVAARGHVLVMAGAGTGKTKTLVERCLDVLARDGARMDELLVVTFTEAAAAELRERLRLLITAQAGHAAEVADAAEAARWQEQLARFDAAPIGTLHGFCLRLIREHFYELGLDPQLAVLDEGAARQRAAGTLDELFAEAYAGADDFSQAVRELILAQGGRDQDIREQVLRLHDYAQTRPDAAGWLAGQIRQFSAAEPVQWRQLLLTAVADWRAEWQPVLTNLAAENEKAAELAAILQRLPEPFSRAEAAAVLAQIMSTDGNWPAKRKGILREPLKGCFDDAKFLLSLAAINGESDPLAEDWTWARGAVLTLLRLTEAFAVRFAEAKRRDGALDFHDLEQLALKLLWDFAANQPTAIAQSWRQKLRFVFVDEYQDINAAQDQIIAALARAGKEANRFLVGDVKQSIYRFRLADPKIFRAYARDWQDGTGTVIPLSENFRSRAGLLNFVNSLCGLVMRPEIGGVAYDAAAALQFGAPAARAALAGAEPRVELRLRFKVGRGRNFENENEDEDDAAVERDDARHEARLVARRLRELVAAGHEIFDDAQKAFRPVAWRDIAVLLRSPAGKADVFAREFERAGVPLAVVRGGFYESQEILDLLSLLQLLDNPLQDVPCLAVLRSPFVGLSLDELAVIRRAARHGHFWTALNHWNHAAKSAAKSTTASEAALRAKVETFLTRFARWRQAARQQTLSQCLEAILAETLYADWLRAQPRGAQRVDGVTRFLQLARQFDEFQRQGLFRFLQFIAAQQAVEAEPEMPPVAADAVRLMSIHKSKGLEFPVVVLADLAKRFNEQELSGNLLIDDDGSLCPKVRPPASGGRYPSLPHWLARRRQRRELRGEELRLLYVALTRARDTLILTGSITEKEWQEKWQQPSPLTGQKIAQARSFADWLALWFARQTSATPAQDSGRLEHLDWNIVPDESSEVSGTGVSPVSAVSGNIESTEVPPEKFSADLNPQSLAELRERLDWQYPFPAATERKAKSSVTALRREAEAAGDDAGDEAETAFPSHRFAAKPEIRNPLSAAETGTAHHKFLQHVALDALGAPGGLAAEADRLARENYLSAEERAVLDLAALAQFWHSPLGEKISAHAANVQRELPFTARFSPAELAAITGRAAAPNLADEFIVVQGVADLVVLLPEEIWLVDFKTDAPEDLPGKVKAYTPQVQLYAAALEKIFTRPVTLRALHFLAARRTERIGNDE